MKHLLLLIFIGISLASFGQGQDSKFTVGFDFLPIIEQSSQPIETIFFRKNQGNYNLRTKVGVFLNDVTFKGYKNEESDDEESLFGTYITLGFDKFLSQSLNTNIYYGAELVGFFRQRTVLGRGETMGFERILDINEKSYQVGINSLVGFDIKIYEKLSVIIESAFFIGHENTKIREEETIDGEIVSFINDSIPVYKVNINPISSIILTYKL